MICPNCNEEIPDSKDCCEFCSCLINKREEPKMENQHRKIKGYRELSQGEIDIMNTIKEIGIEIGEIVDELAKHTGDDGPDQRWVALGKTHLQQGLMALIRSVAKPEFF